jgi:ABC-2 type transport system permease protein
MEDVRAAVYIALKDLREYYLKPGTVSWGLLFPFFFMLKRGGPTEWLAPGMIALALFFGSTSMSAMSIVFERRIESFERLLLFPISYTSIALGKTLSSFLLGIASLIPVLALV